MRIMESPVILGGMTFAVVLFGLGVVAVIMLLPALLLVLSWNNQTLLTAVALEYIHLHQLWTCPLYLYFCRRLLYPLRKLLMPIVFFVARGESIREGVPTLFLNVDDITASEEDLLKSFCGSIRYRYKQMKKKYKEHGIQCETVRSEESLNLSQLVPLIWNHQQQRVGNNKSIVVVEFIKRFLVVFTSTHAVLDLYYKPNDTLCAMQLSVRQASVLHGFMYFSTESQAGIWYHSILNTLLRGVINDDIVYINGHVHQTQSKRYAGLEECPCTTNHELLGQLYPWAFFTKDLCISTTNLWQDDDSCTDT